MFEIKNANDLMRLQRIALNAQGLLQLQPFGRGLAGTQKAIQHIGYVQIDTIAVVERAHHHVLYSRVPDYKPAMLDQLLLNRVIFEYWAHAAAFLPIEDFRFSLPYKRAIKNGQTHWHKKPDRKLMTELLARIRSDGPIRSRDLDSAAIKTNGWWDWKPAKKALEQLYMEGDLMVSHRRGFEKFYDLTDRVLPSGVNSVMPTIEAFASHLLEQQLRCHGLVSLKGLTYLRRNALLRKAMKALIDERVASGDLTTIRLTNGAVYFIDVGMLEQRLPKASGRVLILSPFDNGLIQRDRLRSLFRFDYQLECYLPEVKREYGYFCLPLLYSDQFVGRMDCKVYRHDSRLEIKALYIERDGLDQERFSDALTKAIVKFCKFQCCDQVIINRVQPRKWLRKLHHALRNSLQ